MEQTLARLPRCRKFLSWRSFHSFLSSSVFLYHPFVFWLIIRLLLRYLIVCPSSGSNFHKGEFVRIIAGFSLVKSGGLWRSHGIPWKLIHHRFCIQTYAKGRECFLTDSLFLSIIQIFSFVFFCWNHHEASFIGDIIVPLHLEGRFDSKDPPTIHSRQIGARFNRIVAWKYVYTYYIYYIM